MPCAPCNHNCRQGRACPTHQACHVPDPDDFLKQENALTACVRFGLTALLLFVALIAGICKAFGLI